ncbi:hypothetical protein Ahy_B02g057750 [Arachis hypogaea]|uniref:Aminotransferase-like plant mobile domain-containing protein n=1 Tax=Arachis hypogaea TaxID=3818 RepID=A0A445ACQ9_ARAHY|nr:hypothetical protein Ahy_B02g057750 [Arachis hypogaea]
MLQFDIVPDPGPSHEYLDWWYQHGRRFLSPELILGDPRAATIPAKAIDRGPGRVLDMDQLPDVPNNRRVARRQRLGHDLASPNRNLLVRKLDPPQTWNPMVENYLRATGFFHVSRIGIIRGFHPMLAALVERWRPETHSFVLPIGEVTVTLEDVAHIFGLPIDGKPVSGWTYSSSDFVQSQGIAIFGRQPSVSHNVKSYIKLGWVRRIRDAEPLDTEESIRRYVRCHIFCLLGSTLFTDKSTAYTHAKYLPLLRDFEQIHTYSWGAACLAHLYRALCRASRYDTKEMDGPLNLLFVWAWERMPCLAPVPRQTLPPAEIPVARRWSHSERTTAWLSKTVETFRHDIDYMQEDFLFLSVPHKQAMSRDLPMV